MLRKCFLLGTFFLCLSLNSFPQALKIEYAQQTVGGCIFYKEAFITDSFTVNRAIPGKVECTHKVAGSGKDFFVKDKRKNFCYTIEERQRYVSDTLHLMKWQLTKSTKEILGFKCKSATTTFRGREYIAYYTEKIPVSDGPWKFGGLPGLILAVEATDGSYKFLVHKIIQNYKPTPDDFEELKLLKTTKFISFQEFVIQYKKDIDDTVASMKARKGTAPHTVRLKFDRIEIIYPEVNTGKGIEY